MSTKIKHPGGRPPIYKTALEMQEVIDSYFTLCEGELLKDEDGNPAFTDKGFPIYLKYPKPPTITGLALALGFNSRQALLNYQGRKEFNDTVTRAKARAEEYAETRLYDKDGANGAKFSLSNNFKGWADKSEVDLTAGLTIKVELTDD